MTVYIDNNYKCHTSNDGTMRSFDVPFFDNKCIEFIEGYQYIPDGEVWIRDDDVEFKGEMIAPFTEYTKLEKAQLIYEKEQAEEALQILLEGVETE